jgi:hypothetical protein
MALPETAPIAFSKGDDEPLPFAVNEHTKGVPSRPAPRPYGRNALPMRGEARRSHRP